MFAELSHVLGPGKSPEQLQALFACLFSSSEENIPEGSCYTLFLNLAASLLGYSLTLIVLALRFLGETLCVLVAPGSNAGVTDQYTCINANLLHGWSKGKHIIE